MAHICPSLSFITCVPTEDFLVALDHPGKIYFSCDYGFPNLTPGCAENYIVFVSGYLPLLPSSAGFLFVFEFVQ